MKLLDNQGIDSLWTLASLSDGFIATIHDVIRRSGDLVSGKTADMENQISFLVVKNPKLAAFMFERMLLINL